MQSSKQFLFRKKIKRTEFDMSKNGINTAFEPPESFAAQNSQTAAYPEDFSDSDYAGSDLSGYDLSDSGFPSSDFPSLDSSNSKNKDVRRIIELLGSKLTLPAAKKSWFRRKSLPTKAPKCFRPFVRRQGRPTKARPFRPRFRPRR